MRAYAHLAQHISLSYQCLLPAEAADEAVRMVRPPQGRNHLSSDVLVTAVTLGPIETLVVLCTNVLARVVEETRVHQVTAAH